MRCREYGEKFTEDFKKVNFDKRIWYQYIFIENIYGTPKRIFAGVKIFELQWFG